MGCTFSHSHVQHDRNTRVFKVFNVDDQGREVFRGKLEITESYLILHHRNRDPMMWPLRGLRRYGFDSELFSFESGRRCPSGPGIYAFKCKRAEALFNMVQEYIQRAGQSAHLPVEQYGYLRPSQENAMNENRYNQPLQHRSNGRANMVQVSNNSSPLEGAEPSPTPSGHYYINNIPCQPSVVTDAPPFTQASGNNTPNGTTQAINYAELDLQASSTGDGMEATGGLSMCSNTVEVVDVDKQIFVSLPIQGDGNSLLERRLSARKRAAQEGIVDSANNGTHAYANMNVGLTDMLGHIEICEPTNRTNASLPGSPMITPSSVPVTPAHAQLHAPSSPHSMSSSNPESPTKRTESYATIDFHKTAALSNSTKNATRPLVDNPSVLRSREANARITRHDSSMPDLTTSADEGCRKTRHDLDAS